MGKFINPTTVKKKGNHKPSEAIDIELRGILLTGSDRSLTNGEKAKKFTVYQEKIKQLIRSERKRVLEEIKIQINFDKNCALKNPIKYINEKDFYNYNRGYDDAMAHVLKKTDDLLTTLEGMV